jgi:hypothetical protein
MKRIIFLCMAVTFSLPAPAANPTPDWYKCTGRTTSNEWNFARVFYGCNASEFGSDSVVRDAYSPVIFADAKARDAERRRYMEELHAVIRDAAEYYLKKRKPGASSAEIENFKLGILTTAAQESYWSHYRLFTDNRYKMMRGDVGHGHGMMQVDDRHHFPAVQQGLGWNLLGNLAYAMDIYYDAWQRAASQSCVGSATNWEARIRAAWAAYNGGPSRLCRWTNPNDRWAHNDKGFYDHLRLKRWRQFIGNFNKPASVNVPCLIEKRENCPKPGEPERPQLRENVLYRSAAGVPCVLKGGGLQCLAEFRDHVCLRAVSAFTDTNPEVVADEVIHSLPRQTLDRHATCAAFESSLIGVGQMAEAKLNINLRATPGGGLVGLMPKGEVAEVLDFEIRNLASRDRYYKVQVGTQVGFVYAGNASNHGNWLVPSQVAPLHPVVARVGESLQIVNSVGINMRATAGGTFLLLIPVNTRLVVQDVVVQGAENYVYYKVSYNGRTGYIYSGALLPTNTVASWTRRLP